MLDNIDSEFSPTIMDPEEFLKVTSVVSNKNGERIHNDLAVSSTCHDGAIAEKRVLAKVTKQRTWRNTLAQKRDFVLQFFAFVVNSELDHIPELTEACMNGFKPRNNNNDPIKLIDFIDNRIFHSWIRAFKRGDYDSWGGMNDLSSYKANSAEIVRHLNKTLSQKHVGHGTLNEIVIKHEDKSHEYGVIAKKDIPINSFIGYYMGKVVDCSEANRRVWDHEYMILLNKTEFVDSSDKYSCFARYYKCSIDPAAQNVCILRQKTINPQNNIVLVTTKNVEKGSELVLSCEEVGWSRSVMKASYRNNISSSSHNGRPISDIHHL
jgi:hypothetical protein